MREAVEDLAHHAAGRGANALAPVHEARRTPLEMALMRLGPMPWPGRGAAPHRAPDMHRDALAVSKQLDRRRREAHIDRRAHQEVGHTIEVPIDGDVVVDVHFGGPPLRQFVSRGGERTQRGALGGFEDTSATARELLKRALVYPGASICERLIELRPGRGALMPERW